MEACLDNLVFIPETHEYRYNDMVVPSVSAIIRRFFTPPLNKNGMELGTYVHDTVRLWLDNNLNVETLSPGLSDYLQQFQAFVAATAFKVEGHDVPFYHPLLKYAGTPDLWGAMNTHRLVIDIKTGDPQKWHQLQVAAYASLLAANGLAPECAALLYLSPSSHRLVVLQRGAAEEAATIWIAIRRLYTWAEGI
jgi:CRISPR/Cas system-associated exonuclease Cas4 (RecB family)